MKKIICLFVVFVICFLMLVSCSSDVGKVYCLGVSDGGSLDVDIGGFINEEISGYCGDRFYDKSAPATVQVTFMGTTYSGKYSYSNHGDLSPLVRDHYSGEGYTFAIVRKTGKLAELDLPSPDVASDALPVACNIDEGEEVAIDFLKNIADIENYKLVDKMTTPYIVGQTLSDEECWGYSYTFVRFVNGIATNDTTSDAGAPDFEVLKDTGYIVRTEKGRLALAVDVNIARQGTDIKERVTMLMLIN